MNCVTVNPRTATATLTAISLPTAVKISKISVYLVRSQTKCVFYKFILLFHM